jgi:hypothetical protein
VILCPYFVLRSVLNGGSPNGKPDTLIAQLP